MELSWGISFSCLQTVMCLLQFSSTNKMSLQTLSIKSKSVTYLIAAYRVEGAGACGGCGEDSCILMPLYRIFWLNIKQIMDCMKFLFCWEFIVQDWLRSCGDDKFLWNTRTLLRLAFVSSSDCILLYDQLVHINQKLTTVAEWGSINNLCTTADKIIQDLSVIIYLSFLIVCVLFVGEHLTVCVGRERCKWLFSL